MIFTPDFSVFIYKTEHVHWKRPLNQQIPRGGCFGGRPAQWHSPLGQATQVHGSARGRGRPGKAAVGAGQAGQGAASAISLGPRHRAHFSVGWDPGQAGAGDELPTRTSPHQHVCRTVSDRVAIAGAVLLQAWSEQ